MLQKSVLTFLITIVCGGVFSWGDNNAEIIQRTGEDSIASGSVPSNIPYGYRIDSLSPDMIKILSSVNLSNEAGKRLFAGYGVFDKNNAQCKYLDSGVNMEEFNSKFHKIKVFSGHTYAISRSPMSYNDCLSLAATYSGSVFNPNSASENSAVIGASTEVYGEDIWIGVWRKNCLEGYLNTNGQNQNYTNFADSINNCDESKLYAYKPAQTSLWSKENSGAAHKCMIEINSLDIARPIEVCAPWWRIERTYKLEPKDEVTINGIGLDVYGINQATLPVRMTTCLSYDKNASTAGLANRDIICKTYYDMTMGPQCVNDIFQSSCFVDTCKGYVTNVCSKNPVQPKQEPGMKDYVWGYIEINDVLKRVKIKQGIQSWAYTCPPSGESLKKCKAMGDVVVFPHQCDAAICSNYKKCIGNKESRTSCYQKYPCQEVYGEANDPVVENGQLVGFRGKCGETSIINTNINKISSITEKCLKYAEIKDVIREVKKCTNTAKEQVYEVNTSLTQEDIYANREDCIRLNNTETSRPKMKMIFNYVNNGFFNLVLTKSYIDQKSDVNISLVKNTLANDLQYMILKKTDGNSTTENKVQPNRCNALVDPKWDSMRIGAFVNINDNDDNATATNTGLLGFLYKTKSSTSKCLSNEIYGDSRCYLDKDKNGVVDVNNTSCPGFFTRYTLESGGDKRCIAPVLVSYDRIALVEKNSDYANINSRIGFDAVDVGGTIDLSAYDISWIRDLNGNSISELDIYSKQVIVLGGSNIVLGDNISKRIRYFNNANDIDNSTVEIDSGNTGIIGRDCTDFATCKSFSVNTVYANESQSQQCRMTSNNDVANNTPANETDIEDVDPNSIEYPNFITEKDSIVTEIDGYNDIFSVQEYADGKFGHASNYHFMLPKNNTVSIDDKEIFPIVPQYALDLGLTYDYYIRQYLQNTKNESPTIQQGSYSASTIGSSAANLAVSAGVGLVAAYGTYVVLASIFGASGVGLVVFVVVMLFGPNIKWGDLQSNWSVQRALGSKYVPNVYGYDLRLIDEGKGIATYSYEKLSTPTAKRDTFEKIFRQHHATKKWAFYWQGYEKAMVDNVILRPYEKEVQGYPGKCKWYKPSCKKTKKYEDGRSVANIIKQVNNVYLGATNTVSIFVPYLGDYVVSAFTKGGMKLGEVIISSNDFIEGGASQMSHATVAFGINNMFQLADGMEDGNITKACRRDLMVEWGGGVSGVYYENLTPEGNDCSKSNDQYVQQNYAQYLLIRPVGANKPFKIDMTKPMPYANRFFLVTYGKLENRKYKCYEKGDPCKVD